MANKVNYNIIIISTVVALITVVILVIFLKKNKKNKVKAIVAPIDDKAFEGQNISKDVSDKAAAMAARLYEDMKGFNWLGHDNSIYEDLNQFSDHELSVVYYCFNSNYGENETLTQWLINENFRVHNLTDSIILRLQKLNLI